MRITNVKRLIAISLLCVFPIIAVGCNKTSRQAYPNACIGVLYSTDSGNRSVIEWYDSELNPLGTDSYPFSGASVSQTNAHIQGDTVFLAPTGEEQKRITEKLRLSIRQRAALRKSIPTESISMTAR